MGTRHDDSVAFDQVPAATYPLCNKAFRRRRAQAPGPRRGATDVDFRPLGKPLIDALRGVSSIEDHFDRAGLNRRATPSPLVGGAMDLMAGA
jgi:hypothetical protein